MKDPFNEGKADITHFVILHPFLKRSKILLTLIKHLTLIKSNLSKKIIQVMHSVFCVVPFADVTYIGHFLIY